MCLGSCTGSLNSAQYSPENRGTSMFRLSTAVLDGLILAAFRWEYQTEDSQAWQTGKFQAQGKKVPSQSKLVSKRKLWGFTPIWRSAPSWPGSTGY